MSDQHFQPEFDFAALEQERPLFEHLQRLEAAARAEFSEKNLCIAWVTRSDPRNEQEWWNGLPEYERNGLLETYRCEREIANLRGVPMTPYSVVLERVRLGVERDNAFVSRMATDIRQAAAERRPMPWQASPDANPCERSRFNRCLNLAMQEAGACVIEQPPVESPRKRGAARVPATSA